MKRFKAPNIVLIAVCYELLDYQALSTLWIASVTGGTWSWQILNSD